MGKRLMAGGVAASAVVALLAAPAPSGAVVPGTDGRIAFGAETTQGGSIELFSVRPDGSHLRQLTHTGGFNACASWSPDDGRLAFCSDRGGSFDIYVMNADGSHVRHVPTGVDYAIFPSWSPDGRRLSFVGANGDGGGDIYTIKLDGTGERNLTHSAADDGTQGANWSPSGDKIVFDSNRNGKYDVYTMNPDGSGRHQITAGAGDNTARTGARTAPPSRSSTAAPTAPGGRSARSTPSRAPAAIYGDSRRTPARTTATRRSRPTAGRWSSGARARTAAPISRSSTCAATTSGR